MAEVPESWWRSALEVIHHPVACVNSAGYFLWVNESFSRLVGYSDEELRELRNEDITVNDDIGAELKNLRALQDGKDKAYTMIKRLRHKRGILIPVEVTAWRHPSDYQQFECYIMEAMQEHATAEQLHSFRAHCLELITQVERRCSEMEKAFHMREEIRRDTSTNTNVNVGNNSTDVFRWIVIAIVALIGAAAYLTYIGGFPFHKGEAQPPRPTPIESFEP